jgi:hypothetical protein
MNDSSADDGKQVWSAITVFPFFATALRIFIILRGPQIHAMYSVPSQNVNFSVTHDDEQQVLVLSFISYPLVKHRVEHVISDAFINGRAQLTGAIVYESKSAIVHRRPLVPS